MDIPLRIRKNMDNPEYIKEVKDITGRFLGVNLEPVPKGIDYPAGRVSSAYPRKVPEWA